MNFIKNIINNQKYQISIYEGNQHLHDYEYGILLRGVDAVVYNFDVTDKSTLDYITFFKYQFQKHSHSDFPIYMNANKCDLHQEISNNFISYIAEKYSTKQTFFTSAKKNIGVEEMFNHILSHIKTDNDNGDRENSKNSSKGNNLLNILFLGHSLSGKTSLIKRITKNQSELYLTPDNKPIKGIKRYDDSIIYENMKIFFDLFEISNINAIEKQMHDVLSKIDAVVLCIDVMHASNPQFITTFLK